MTRRTKAAAVPLDEPVSQDDAFNTWTAVFTLADGHPLRGNRCIECGMMIGGRPARFVSVVITEPASCVCGQVPTLTQLHCGEHPIPSAPNTLLMFARLVSHVHRHAE